MGDTIAAQLVGHQPHRFLSLTLQQSSKESPRCTPVPMGLYKDVNHVTVLIHRAPQILALTVDRHEDFVQEPRISESTLSSLQLPRVVGAELPAPLPHGFIGHDDSSFGQQILNIPEAHAVSVVEPDRMADDLRWKAMPKVTGSASVYLGNCAGRRVNLTMASGGGRPQVQHRQGILVTMKLLLANPRCYCAGVDRAIQIVDLALEQFGAPVYVRKEIVHNRHVVGWLRDRGAVFVDELGEVPEGALVVFSAHGVGPSVHAEAKRRSLRVIDATCPLVNKVHLEVDRFVDEEGYHILFIGHVGHEEVEGTMGHSPDHTTLIENVEQARTTPIPQHEKLMVLTQTTLSMDDTRHVVDALRERFAYLEVPPADDICYATQNRQNAVKAMCENGIGLLLVVGSENSSNAARLAEIGAVRGIPSHLINSHEDVSPAWLAGVTTVGVTGGASTPSSVVHDVVTRLEQLGVSDVEPCVTAEETTVFQLPTML